MDRWLYRHTDGRLSALHFAGGRATALPTLLLTTTGRKTGQSRTTAVLYVQDGEEFVVVGSNFGQRQHPSWSANLLTNPNATVQVHETKHSVKARLASEDEKAGLWPRLLQLYPPWEAYATRTDRSFRAFFLEPL